MSMSAGVAAAAAAAASTLATAPHLMRALRLVLHVAVALSLTVRSAQISGALHPYERALASEWVRLLFFVDTTAAVAPSPFSGGDGDGAVVPLTLPHFLMDVEEEVAASVDDEFFSGGFAARASALPVGMLFTINETRAHLHGAVANYFRLAEVALDSYVLFDNVSAIPAPELTVRSNIGDDTVEQRYLITDPALMASWPEPLRANASVSKTREFFDQLDAMQLRFVLGLKETTKSNGDGEQSNAAANPGVADSQKMYVWRLVMRYDLQNQGHLEVAMNFDLKHMLVKLVRSTGQARSVDDFFEGSDDDDDSQAVPAIVFDTSTAFDWGLLAVISIYQLVELALKRSRPRADRPRPPHHVFRRTRRETKCAFVWKTLKMEANDFWFWFILVLNVSTVACLLQTWRHAYRLSLDDTLCFVFASCCALHWVSLVRYLQVNARFTILGLTLQRGLPRVAQFLAGVLPIFVGFVLFGTIMFGAKVPRFQTASATATTLFSVANGDEIHDTFNAVAYTPWIGQLYVYSYMILFSYVVLMVCIGIIEDAFFSAVFPASWPSSAAGTSSSSRSSSEGGGGGGRRSSMKGT